MLNNQQLTPALLLLAALVPAEGAANPVVIRMATVLPKGTSYHRVLQAMGEEWRKAPNGGVALTLFTDSTMGDEADIVRRMRVGQLQGAALSVMGLSEIDRSVTALQYMPMMFRSLEEVDLIREKLRPRLEAALLSKGFVALFWSDAGWIRFFSKEPALMPEDFRRFQMFAWSGDNYQVDLMKSLGYQPVPLVMGDILPGLQTGMISSIALAPFYALAGQVYGPAPYMLELNWAPLVGAAVVSRKAWEVLPADTRDALRAAANRAGAEMKIRGRAEAEQSVEAMKKRGLKVQALTPAAEAAWRKIAGSVYPKIRGAMVPAELFDQVRAWLDEQRAAGGRAAK